MAKLYEINREIEDLISANFDPDTGMLNPEIIDELKALEMRRNDKILSVVKYKKNLESDADQHKAEAKRQNEMASKLQRKADSISEYLYGSLQPGESFEDSQASVSWSKKPSVDISDYMVDPLPDKYISKTVKYTISKTALLEDMKVHGFEWPGVSIKYNLIIK